MPRRLLFAVTYLHAEKDQVDEKRMPISFPTALDALTNPTATDPMNSPTVPHPQQHSDANDILESLEAKVGIDGSDDPTSHDYKLSGVTGTAKARATDDPIPISDVTGLQTSLNTKAALDGIDVAGYATGGSGTSGAPWTGWDTACPWAASTRFVFRPGTYSYSASPTFGNHRGIELIGAGAATVLKYTGSGVCVDFVATQTDVQLSIVRVLVDGFTIDGTGGGTIGLMARMTHFGRFRNLWIKNVTDDVMRVEGCVCPEFTSIFYHDTVETAVAIPVNGFVFDEHNPGAGAIQTTVASVNDCYVAGVSGVGLWVKSAFQLVVTDGAFERNNKNLQVDAASYQCEFHTDFESSTTACTVAGNRHLFECVNGSPSDMTITAADCRFARSYFENVTNNGSRNTFEGCLISGTLTGTDARQVLRGGTTESVDKYCPARVISTQADEIAHYVESALNANNGHAIQRFKPKNGTLVNWDFYALAAGVMGSNWNDAAGDFFIPMPSGKKIVYGDASANSYATLAVTGTKVGVATGAPSARLHVVERTIGNEAQRIESEATNDDVRESVYQNRVATTDATVTTLHTVAIPASTTLMIEALVTARRTGGSAGTAEDGASYKRIATYKNAAGTATIIGAISTPHTAESQAGWDCTLTASGANVLLRVTGATNNNVSWHATVRVWQVGS
jgi:hypothetical protein